MPNHYTDSKGKRYSQKQIDYLIRKAKAKKIQLMLDDYGYIFCEDCGTNKDRIDCSHDISVDQCKKTGQLEKSWDVNNITMRCRKCHSEKDGLNLQFKNNENTIITDDSSNNDRTKCS